MATIEVYLVIEDGALAVKPYGSKDHGGVRTIEELGTVLAQVARDQGYDPAAGEIEFDFLCSSSLDYPAEDTDDAAVIELCRAIRS